MFAWILNMPLVDSKLTLAKVDVAVSYCSLFQHSVLTCGFYCRV